MSTSIPQKIDQNIPYPCFPDSDVPIACFFIHLEQGYTMAQFLQDFPTIEEQQVLDLLNQVIEVLKKQPIIK